MSSQPATAISSGMRNPTSLKARIAPKASRSVAANMLLGPALTVLILAPEYFLPVRMLGADYHATLDGKEAGAAINQVIERGKAAEQKQKEAYANVVAHADMAEDGTGYASLSLGKRKAATSTIRVVLNDKMAAGHLAPD